MYRYLKIIYMSAVLSLLAAGTAFAQDIREQEAKIAKLEKEIEIINRQLKANDSKSSSALSDLTLIRKNISNRKALVQESDRTIRRYSDSLYLAQREINRLQARVDTLTSHYARLVRSAYKNRDARVWYMYMLASENLGQAFRRFGYFKNLSNQMKSEAQDIREMQEELQVKKARLSDMKKEAEAVKGKRLAELEKLKKDEAKADGIVRKLKRDRKKYEKELVAKRNEKKALNREISRIIAESMKTGDQKKKDSRKTEVDMKLDAEFSKNKGKLPWPADGAVISRFGKQYHPVLKNIELPPNNGIDLSVGVNTEVKAVFDGIVIQVITMPGYNKCVLVQHGNYFTLYCKMRSVSVKNGDKVKTGAVLGVIDTINGQTQMHFEVWKGKTPQNPEHWLK